MAKIVRVRGKGQITLPPAVREAARLEEGDSLEVEMTEEGILLRPKKLVDATQAWFWTSEWQGLEREASEDIAAGRGETFENGEELLAFLETRLKPDADL